MGAANTTGRDKKTKRGKSNDDGDVINRRYLSLYINDWKKKRVGNCWAGSG